MMKPYLVSLGAGLLVGVVYGLLTVRSPAPPVVAPVGASLPPVGLPWFGAGDCGPSVLPLAAFAGVSGCPLPPIPGCGVYPRVAPAGGAATGSAPVLVSIESIELLPKSPGARCGGGEKLPGS